MVSSLQCPLPLELYRPIIEQIADKSVLYSLTTVSSLFRQEAERVLYNTVELNPEDKPRFCQFFTQFSPRIAQYVRRCSVFLAVPDIKDCMDPRIDIVVNIRKAFLHMKNIRTLSVNGHLRACRLGKLLEGCAFDLTSFASTSTLDKATLMFLESQSNVTEITTLHSKFASNHTLSPHSLPNLSVVRALTPCTVEDIVPTRPVTHIEVYVWSQEPAERFAASVLQSSGPVRSLLVIQGFKLFPTDLEALSLGLSRVYYLGECTFFGSVASFLPAFRRFPSLRILIINNQSVGDWDDQEATVKALHRACKDLHTVIFTMALMPRQMWSRDAGGWRMSGRPRQSLCCDLWSAKDPRPTREHRRIYSIN